MSFTTQLDFVTNSIETGIKLVELAPEVVFAIIESEKQFAIDFDDAWQWIGYTRKDSAKDLLVSSFEKNVDFFAPEQTGAKKKGRGGHNRELIFLTVDCFKSFCMMAGTLRGKEVRRYFLSCEAELKRRVDAEKKKTQSEYREKLHNATAKVYLLDDPVKWVDRGRIFQESFYRAVYKLKGIDFTSGQTKHPIWMANITIDLVYHRLQPRIWEDICKKNPRLNGRRKYCCHQFLSDNIGNPHLKNHLYAITTLMEGCTSWMQFTIFVDRFHPKRNEVQMDILFELLAQSPEDFEHWNGLVS